jgi:hypothetical protein
LAEYKDFNDLMDRIRQRNCHYIKLGWITPDAPAEELEKLIYDDELWEKAKNLPIDPNNWLDQWNRMIKKAGKLEGAEREKYLEEITEHVKQHWNKRPRSM